MTSEYINWYLIEAPQMGVNWIPSSKICLFFEWRYDRFSREEGGISKSLSYSRVI